MPRYRVPQPAVAHQLIDGEIVIINFVTGRYYSLSGSGPMLWELLVDGVTTTEMATALAARYDAADVDLAAVASEIADRLAAEGLVVVDEDDTTQARAIAQAAAALEPWCLPTLETFTDLEDLILLDPVHDVADRGWPAVKPAADESAAE